MNKLITSLVIAFSLVFVHFGELAFDYVAKLPPRSIFCYGFLLLECPTKVISSRKYVYIMSLISQGR